MSDATDRNDIEKLAVRIEELEKSVEKLKAEVHTLSNDIGVVQHYSGRIHAEMQRAGQGS